MHIQSRGLGPVSLESQFGLSVMSLAGDEMQFGPVPRRCPQAGGVVQAPQKRIRYLRVGMPGKLRRYNRLQMSLSSKIWHDPDHSLQS